MVWWMWYYIFRSTATIELGWNYEIKKADIHLFVEDGGWEQLHHDKEDVDMEESTQATDNTSENDDF